MYRLDVRDHLRDILNYVTDTRALATTTLALSGVYLVYWLVYGLFLCPTRHIPGPVLTRFSKFYFFRLLLRGTLSADIYELHKKYGIRIRVTHVAHTRQGRSFELGLG